MMSPPRARAVSGTPGATALRDHLIAVTLRLLIDEGLEGLTARRIARTAQVSDGVLYNHFATKDDLLLAALVARSSQLLSDFRASCPTPGTATVTDNVRQLTAATLEVQRGLLPLLVGMIGKPELLRRYVAELHAPALGGPATVLHALHGYLEQEQRLGRLPGEGQTHLVGVLLLAITQLQALATHVRPGGVTSADAGRELEPFVTFLTASLSDPPDLPPDPSAPDEGPKENSR